MDPYYEQRLRDEVIYLHSLWHQGPPPRSSPYTNLHPFNSTHFKKHKKNKTNFYSRQPKKVGSFSGTEWPVKPLPAAPPVTQSGWPELKLKPNPSPPTLTPEELAKHNWNQVQQKALKAAKEFYSRNAGSDAEESDEDDDDDMDEDGDDVEDKEYEFFWKMFDGDEELKGYYVKHCGGGGEFSCLVCGGANEKYRKRFKDCIALVQHSISIAKTKKIRSHRAYGQVICKVLGWDIDHLPSSIVSDFKSGELQGNDVNAGLSSAGLNKIMGNRESNLEVESNGKVHDVSDTVQGESMVCEDTSVAAYVEEENTEKQVLNDAEGNTGGVVNNLVRIMPSLSENLHSNSPFYPFFDTFFPIVAYICLTTFLSVMELLNSSLCASWMSWSFMDLPWAMDSLPSLPSSLGAPGSLTMAGLYVVQGPVSDNGAGSSSKKVEDVEE